VILDPERSKRWDPFPEDFREDRLRVIAGLCKTVWKPESYIFVHGDLNEDNILIDGDRISLLDFGDACLAPAEYEYALAATELFRLDRAFLRGFFPEYYESTAARPLDELADLITRGILIHDFGGSVLRQRFGLCESLHSIEMLRDFIRGRL
jgi:Ser/Thr protein kinase RdoA (MazF antagonist)